MELNEEEKRMIWKAWDNSCEHQFQLAFTIYENFFRLDSTVVHLFPMELHPNSKKILHLTKFRRMALRLIRILQTAATDAENSTEIDDLLFRIGKMHAKFKLKNFADRHWTAMEQAMLLALKSDVYKCVKLNEDEKHVASNAWRKIVRHVIEKTKLGFDAETKLSRRLSGQSKKRKSIFDFKNLFCSIEDDVVK